MHESGDSKRDAGGGLLCAANSRCNNQDTRRNSRDNGSEPLWVCFRFGRYWDESWRELADFVLGYLAPRLSEKVGDGAKLMLRPCEAGGAIADLSVRPEFKEEGEWCPACEFWHGRDRFRGQRVH